MRRGLRRRADAAARTPQNTPRPSKTVEAARQGAARGCNPSRAAASPASKISAQIGADRVTGSAQDDGGDNVFRRRRGDGRRSAALALFRPVRARANNAAIGCRARSAKLVGVAFGERARTKIGPPARDRDEVADAHRFQPAPALETVVTPNPNPMRERAVDGESGGGVDPAARIDAVVVPADDLVGLLADRRCAGCPSCRQSAAGRSTRPTSVDRRISKAGGKGNELRPDAAFAVLDDRLLRFDLIRAQLRGPQGLFHCGQVCRAAARPRFIGRRRVLHCHYAYTYGAASSQYVEADV